MNDAQNISEAAGNFSRELYKQQQESRETMDAGEAIHNLEEAANCLREKHKQFCEQKNELRRLRIELNRTLGELRPSSEKLEQAEKRIKELEDVFTPFGESRVLREAKARITELEKKLAESEGIWRALEAERLAVNHKLVDEISETDRLRDECREYAVRADRWKNMSNESFTKLQATEEARERVAKRVRELEIETDRSLFAKTNRICDLANELDIANGRVRHLEGENCELTNTLREVVKATEDYRP